MVADSQVAAGGPEVPAPGSGKSECWDTKGELSGWGLKQGRHGERQWFSPFQYRVPVEASRIQGRANLIILQGVDGVPGKKQWDCHHNNIALEPTPPAFQSWTLLRTDCPWEVHRDLLPFVKIGSFSSAGNPLCMSHEVHPC